MNTTTLQFFHGTCAKGGRIATGILVIAALGFIVFEWRFDPDRLKGADGIDQTKVDPRLAISTTINSILGTTPQPNEH